MTAFESALREATRLVGALSMPVLLALLAIGLVTGILQAMTRVRDRSLSAVPRILVVGAVVLLTGSWAANRLVTFTTSMAEAAIAAGR